MTLTETLKALHSARSVYLCVLVRARRTLRAPFLQPGERYRPSRVLPVPRDALLRHQYVLEKWEKLYDKRGEVCLQRRRAHQLRFVPRCSPFFPTVTYTEQVSEATYSQRCSS